MVAPVPAHLAAFPVALTVASPARGQAPLALERLIPLPNVSGRIDHMAVDLARKRLFVAELGDGTVDVIDLDSGRVLHRIDSLREPQGVGYAPGADVLAVASAGDGTVHLFSGPDYRPTRTVELGSDADNVRLDPASGAFVVGYGDGGLAVIDPSSGTVRARIALAAHPEGFQIDPQARRVVVNVPDARQIAVVDLAAGAQVSTWRVPDHAGNFPMALDPGQSLVATVFRDPARLVLLDSRTGARIADLATCDDADDVFLDPRRARAYVSCGAGEVDVYAIAASGSAPLGHLATHAGARTALFVPDDDRLFVAARAGWFGFGADAAILVFRPTN